MCAKSPRWRHRLPSSNPRIPRTLNPTSARLARALVILGLVAGLAGAVNAEEANASAQQLEALDKRIKDVNAWLQKAEDNRGELVRNLRDLEQDLGKINGRLHALRQQEKTLQSELATLESEAQALQGKLASQRVALGAQLRNAWMQGDAPGLKVLLNESDPQELARLMTYHEYLSQDAVTRLETFNATLAQLEQNRARALTARAELAKAQDQTEAERKDREQRQAERQQALAALKGDISERRSELEQLEADRQRLEALVKQVEEAVRTIDLPDQSTPFKQLRAKLPWPASGKVVANYGEPMAGGKMRRNGIIIQAAADEPIHAVHYGRVVFANWLRGFGLLLIIDHGDGYMSLYGQNGGLLKSVGDWVSAGETIALAGEDGGAPGGLYFEIRHNGKPGDPAQWLQR